MARCRRSDPIVLIYPWLSLWFCDGLLFMGFPFSSVLDSHTPAYCGHLRQDEDTAPFWDPNSEQFPHLSPSAKAAAAAAAGDDDDALAVGLGQHPLDGSGSELEIELSGDGGDAASEVDPADASAAEKTLEQVVADTAEERSNVRLRLWSEWSEWLDAAVAAIYCMVLICCWFFFPSIFFFLCQRWFVLKSVACFVTHLSCFRGRRSKPR